MDIKYFFFKIFQWIGIIWFKIKEILAIPSVRWILSLLFIFVLIAEGIKMGLKHTDAFKGQMNLIAYSLSGIATAAVFFLGRNSHMFREGGLFKYIVLGVVIFFLFKIYHWIASKF